MTEFNLGTLIENRYRVLTVIGTGGMGTLYRVSDEAREGEIVALKTVRLEGPMIEGPKRVEYFQREFQLLTQLRHPNLVSVYDYGITTEGELYFTMEWVEGDDLEPSLRPLEPGETVDVMVQVCRALAYLHARGVIHGDLKPGNVLVTADTGDVGRRIKLVDFGLAHEVRSPESRARYYSPGYTAPETREQRPVDHRTDLYSLGAMWYALLVGEAPMFLPGPGKERLIRFALDEALEGQDQIPRVIGTVVARLMATSPADRYGSANEVIEAVNEVTGSAYELETRETAVSYALRTHFVDREAELADLQALWEQAKSDEGQLVLISGESGVGKTRLVTELEVQAELEGARVVWGQCIESGGSAYHPWREVLRVVVRYVEDVDEPTMLRAGPVLATLLPELWGREYMGALEPPADLEPQAAQRRLNDTIVQVLQAAAESRPTVVVVENAHWADEATLELLRFLARLPGQKGLLVCITYRDDEVEADHLLETLAGEQVRRIRVNRLSPEVTTELVCSMLGLEELPALLTERIQQTTRGNAFFVQEMIRSLAAEGEVLRRTVGGWQVNRDALEEARLPEGIQQTVGRRLNQLSEEGRLVLNWAAVVGMVFWEGGVAAAGQVVWQRVRVALREGLEQGLVVVRDETSFAGEREYLFPNPTVWEVSYESIPEEERQTYHARVAAWLMARSDEEVGEHLGLISDHLERAGEAEQAVVYLKRVGEQAAAQFANAEAVAYFSRALALTPVDDLAGCYALLLAREKVYDMQGAREAQHEDLAALKKLAEALGDRRRQAEVALRRANCAGVTGDYPGAIAAAQEAVHLAQATQDMSQEAAAYMQWGETLWRQGEYEASRLRLEQALPLSRAAGVRGVEADSLRVLGLISWQQVDHAGARDYFEQALQIYREIGNRRYEAGTLNNLALVALERGNPAEARGYYEPALRIFREIGERRGEALVLGNLGVVFDQQGNYAQARTYYEQSLSSRREIDDRSGECQALANLGLLFHNLGDDETAWERGQEALHIAQEIGDRRWEAFARTNQGYVLMVKGRFAEAVESFQQALSARRELGEHSLATESLAGLASVSLAQSNPTLALNYVEEILDYLNQGNTLDGTDEPFKVYLTCYRVLRANQDSRAETVLEKAYALLQERAAKIDDEEMRRSFLENVASHREIIAAWESR